ncbi:hypothetical protein BOG92_033020 [Streptomyces sp. WAC00263]|nr:hypothetical protein BOG92_033020 [Streptomyces sp. WAC00263]
MARGWLPCFRPQRVERRRGGAADEALGVCLPSDYKAFMSVHWREAQRRRLAGLNPETGEPDPVVQDFLRWPAP